MPRLGNLPSRPKAPLRKSADSSIERKLLSCRWRVHRQRLLLRKRLAILDRTPFKVRLIVYELRGGRHRILDDAKGERMTGKTIRLYLVDGVPHGILTAEIMNWTGKIIVGPRSQLSAMAKRDELTRTGIYLLVGPDPDQPDRDRVYIGEGDNVLKRLLAHEKDEGKDFWTRTAVVISKDDNITKSHGRYLESRLIRLGSEAGRAALANGSNPDCPPLPEPDVADMEFFLSQVQMVLPVLGMNFLQPKPSYRDTKKDDGATLQRFVMKEGEKTAYAFEQGSEFVVLKGSPARKEASPSQQSYKGLRESLIAEGRLRGGCRRGRREPQWANLLES